MLIQNYSSLASTQLRKMGLEIVNRGLEAIDTSSVIKNSVRIEGDQLKIKNQSFDLTDIRHVYIIGFGKASCDAIIAINDILSSKITSGIAVDIKTAHCDNPNIKIFKGSHPKPTPDNLIATQEIMELSKIVTEHDLVICIVSGGGSSLLCADQTECDIHNQIYDQFLQTGGGIEELNTLRKHTSTLKGGGLAKLFYPARIIGLIFSDIPGGDHENVASGPTYLDKSTLYDVTAVVDKYHLESLRNFKFMETPKEAKYFEKVSNILLVSNQVAAEAMMENARQLGFSSQIYSVKLTEAIPYLAEKLNSNLSAREVRIGAGEPSVVAHKGQFGKGGRCQQLAVESLPFLDDHQVFIALASDGVDNSEAAGAIVDKQTLQRAANLGLDWTIFKDNLNSFELLSQTGDLILTGPTGANVSDLMLVLHP